MSDPYADDQIVGRFQFGFLRRLWPFVRPYRRGFAACLAILLLSFALELLGPWLLRLAIDGPMRATTAPRDDRLQDAIDLLQSRRRVDGSWPLQQKYAGKVFFDMEKVGGPSRWNTLRALRVLRWWEG